MVRRFSRCMITLIADGQFYIASAVIFSSSLFSIMIFSFLAENNLQTGQMLCEEQLQRASAPSNWNPSFSNSLISLITFLVLAS
jgi:hypothetical protein